MVQINGSDQSSRRRRGTSGSPPSTPKSNRHTPRRALLGQSEASERERAALGLLAGSTVSERASERERAARKARPRARAADSVSRLERTGAEPRGVPSRRRRCVCPHQHRTMRARRARGGGACRATRGAVARQAVLYVTERTRVRAIAVASSAQRFADFVFPVCGRRHTLGAFDSYS